MYGSIDLPCKETMIKAVGSYVEETKVMTIFNNIYSAQSIHTHNIIKYYYEYI